MFPHVVEIFPAGSGNDGFRNDNEPKDKFVAVKILSTISHDATNFLFSLSDGAEKSFSFKSGDRITVTPACCEMPLTTIPNTCCPKKEALYGCAFCGAIYRHVFESKCREPQRDHQFRFEGGRLQAAQIGNW